MFGKSRSASPRTALKPLSQVFPLENLYNAFEPDVPDLLCRALENFRLPLLELALAQRHAIRHADQVRVLELDPGPFVPVIEKHVNGQGLHLGIELLGGGAKRRVSMLAAVSITSKGAMERGKNMPS